MSSNIIKHITKTVLLILILSFVIDKLAFYTLVKISDHVFTGQSIGKLNHYIKVKDKADFLVFGSSRANHNINPISISEKGYNMGMDGRKLAFSTTLIKLLPNKKQTILLHIDPVNAFYNKYTGNDIQALISKYNQNTIIKEEIDKLNQNNLLQNFFWSIGFNGKVLGILKNFAKPKYDYNSYFGYDPIYVSENQRKIFNEILKQDNNKTITCENEYFFNKIYETLIDELIMFCEKNNKTLILFTAPIYNDECKDDNILLSKILKNKKLKYYDFTDFLKGNNNLEYWKDKEHLSYKGAELFTKKIKQILTEID